MTPKEKAEALVDRMYGCVEINRFEAKQCALKAIDEVIQEICATSDKYFIIHRLAYWKEVKDEVEKLN